MQDPRSGTKRRVLGWVLLLVALLLLVCFGTMVHSFGRDFLLAQNAYAAITVVVVILLACAATGAYLLRTAGRR